MVGRPNLYAVVAPYNDGKVLIAVGFNGTVLRSRDAGESWEARPSRTNQTLWSIAVLADRRTLIAVGAVARCCEAWMRAIAGRHGPAGPGRT